MENTWLMLILASRSSARKALLEQAGLTFSLSVAELDERAAETAILNNGGDAAAVAEGLAIAKARSVADRHPDAVVIGADQTLALDGELLHKPRDMSEAAMQVTLLRGRIHHLHAGVAVMREGQLLWSTVEIARLRLRNFDAGELQDVLRREGEAILGCVGGYRLEGPSVRLFESIEGDYFTILGLPLLSLLAALRTHAPETLS